MKTILLLLVSALFVGCSTAHVKQTNEHTVDYFALMEPLSVGKRVSLIVMSLLMVKALLVCRSLRQARRQRER